MARDGPSMDNRDPNGLNAHVQVLHIFRKSTNNYRSFLIIGERNKTYSCFEINLNLQSQEKHFILDTG